GGGMYVHNIHPVHDGLHFMPAILANFLVGLVVGFLVLLMLHFVPKRKKI
ncbi:MAG: DUF808 domain-containing protein, partial [Candidatus Electrothrix sp. AUS1_2]|nr:DUF808 domain-containing protein [Candidatus Electrothrix sp. AUS1_2]